MKGPSNRIPAWKMTSMVILPQAFLWAILWPGSFWTRLVTLVLSGILLCFQVGFLGWVVHERKKAAEKKTEHSRNGGPPSRLHDIA